MLPLRMIEQSEISGRMSISSTDELHLYNGKPKDFFRLNLFLFDTTSRRQYSNNSLMFQISIQLYVHIHVKCH